MIEDIIIPLASHWHHIVITLLITLPITLIGLKIGAYVDRQYYLKHSKHCQ